MVTATTTATTTMMEQLYNIFQNTIDSYNTISTELYTSFQIYVAEWKQECLDDSTISSDDGRIAQFTKVVTPILIHYWYLVLFVLFFWPVFLNLFLALGYGFAWVFWLLTSAAFGCLQLIYVIYHFIMMSIDVMGLMWLKTFAMLRSQITHRVLPAVYRTICCFSSLSRRRKLEGSQGAREPGRRAWMKSVANATNYDEYLEIPTEEPEEDVRGAMVNGGKNNNGSDVGGFFSLRWLKRRRKQREDRNKSERMARATSCANLAPSSPQTTVTRRRLSGNGVMHHSRSATNMPRLEQEDTQLSSRVLGNKGEMLITTTERLREAREQFEHGRENSNFSDTNRYNSGSHNTSNDLSSLKFLLSGVVKRNHLHVDDLLIDDARDVDQTGHHRLSRGDRDVVQDFTDEVCTCLDVIANAPLQEMTSAGEGIGDRNSPPHNEHKSSNEVLSLNTSHEQQQYDKALELNELGDRIKLMKKMKLNTGCSALMLSGGGAQAMYHLGSIKALLETGIYDTISVISGTSGGSITAAMCAIKTSAELLRDVCVEEVATDYLKTGQMKKDNIRWFPSIFEMGAYWMKTKLLVDQQDFKKCCEFYYGDFTFEEAFRRTGKHVCITVSASRNTSGAQRLLLNHISTPHVTLASAVAASCALPGVMKPAKLMAKNSDGDQEVFEVDGVEWIDGSVQADLPFKRISTLFNVSNFIVCQVNFHIVPLLNKAHHPGKQSLYWRIFQSLEWDMRTRALNLSRLGLFPTIFGQDISKIFKQKYHGTLTLVPPFTMMQVFGLKALVNPTIADMKIYLQNGQMSVWPYVDVIKHMLCLETSIEICIERLKERYHSMSPQTQNEDLILGGCADQNDMLPSSFIAASKTRLMSAGREAEFLKMKMRSLESENSSLKMKVRSLERALGINTAGAAVLRPQQQQQQNFSLTVPSIGILQQDQLQQQNYHRNPQVRMTYSSPNSSPNTETYPGTTLSPSKTGVGGTPGRSVLRGEVVVQ